MQSKHSSTAVAQPIIDTAALVHTFSRAKIPGDSSDPAAGAAAAAFRRFQRHLATEAPAAAAADLAHTLCGAETAGLRPLNGTHCFGRLIEVTIVWTMWT